MVGKKTKKNNYQLINQVFFNTNLKKIILTHRQANRFVFNWSITSYSIILLLPVIDQKKLNNALLFLFLLLLPTQFGKYFFFDFSFVNGVRVDYLAPAVYLTDIIVFFLVILNLKQVIKFLKRRFFFFFLFFLILNVVFSLSPPISLWRLVKIVEFLALYAVFAKNKLGEKNILFAFLIGAVFELFLAGGQLLTKHSLGGVFYFFGERTLSLATPGVAKASLGGVEMLRPYSTFSHPNSMGGFYLLLYFFVLSRKKFNQFLILKSLFLLFSSSLLFLSFSKTAIITYLLINILYLVSNVKVKCRLCFAAKIFTPFVLSLIFFQAKTDPYNLQKRLELVRNSLSIIAKHPLFGTGIGNYILAQSRFPTRYYNFLNQPVHNIFLLVVAEVGLPVLAIALFMGKKIGKFLFQKQILYLVLTVFFTGLMDHYWLTLEQNFLLLSTLSGMILKRS